MKISTTANNRSGESCINLSSILMKLLFYMLLTFLGGHLGHLPFAWVFIHGGVDIFIMCTCIKSSITGEVSKFILFFLQFKSCSRDCWILNSFITWFMPIWTSVQKFPLNVIWTDLLSLKIHLMLELYKKFKHVWACHIMLFGMSNYTKKCRVSEALMW